MTSTSSSSSQTYDTSQFYVITTIFNPAGYSSRYLLYSDFAEHMRDTGAQLITIECIFPSLGQTTFAVTNPSNPNHIQVRSEEVYWVKESLINLAWSKLPPNAKWIAWLDADVTFHKKNWIDLTIEALMKNVVVQVFDKANFLGPFPEVKILRTDHSFGYSVVHNKTIDQRYYDEWYPHPGYGWATSVSAFKAMGGLPELDIVGSGDMHFAYSLINKTVMEDAMYSEYKRTIQKNSTRAYEALSALAESQKLKAVGYVPVTLSHNWHGSREDRQYVERWKILIIHQFDFNKDVVRDTNGLLKLSCVDPKKSQMQQDMLQYFALRKEDKMQAIRESFEAENAIGMRGRLLHKLKLKASNPPQTPKVTNLRRVTRILERLPPPPPPSRSRRSRRHRSRSVPQPIDGGSNASPGGDCPSTYPGDAFYELVNVSTWY